MGGKNIWNIPVTTKIQAYFLTQLLERKETINGFHQWWYFSNSYRVEWLRLSGWCIGGEVKCRRADTMNRRTFIIVPKTRALHETNTLKKWNIKVERAN